MVNAFEDTPIMFTSKKTTVIPRKIKHAYDKEGPPVRTAVYLAGSKYSKENMVLSDLPTSYQKCFHEHPRWQLHQVYSDSFDFEKPISKRLGFQKLLKDAQHKQFDHVVVKSIPMFSINTLELVIAYKELEELNIYVHFSDEDLNTHNGNSICPIQIRSAYIQEEHRLQQIAKNIGG